MVRRGRPPPFDPRTMGARPVSYSAPSHRDEDGHPASTMQCHPLHGRCPRKCAADPLVDISAAIVPISNQPPIVDDPAAIRSSLARIYVELRITKRWSDMMWVMDTFR